MEENEYIYPAVDKREYKVRLPLTHSFQEPEDEWRIELSTNIRIQDNGKYYLVPIRMRELYDEDPTVEEALAFTERFNEEVYFQQYLTKPSQLLENTDIGVVEDPNQESEYDRVLAVVKNIRKRISYG